MEYLLENNRISEEVAGQVRAFIRDNQTQLPSPKVNVEPVIKNTLPIRERLRNIIQEKKSNICLSADLTTLDEIIEVKFLLFHL